MQQHLYRRGLSTDRKNSKKIFWNNKNYWKKNIWNNFWGRKSYKKF